MTKRRRNKLVAMRMVESPTPIYGVSGGNGVLKIVEISEISLLAIKAAKVAAAEGKPVNIKRTRKPMG